MNGKKGSMETDIQPSKLVSPESGKKSGSDEMFRFISWAKRVYEFGRADIGRVIFSFKVGLALLLVSLLVLCRDAYNVFGPNIIWAIMTVAIMFEYTVGATFNRGFNRALGSLLAGIFAIIIAQIAISTGPVGEPMIIGFGIFMMGAVTSFVKQWPSMQAYEYGFRVTLFTFCLIIVSGYRMGNPIKTAMERLYSIAIGGVVTVLINVFIFPIWAGEQLHKELVKNFDSVADSLEECVSKYLTDDGSEHPEFSKTVMDDFPDEPAFKRCKLTLNSTEKLDSLAVSAKWEPPHGRFRHFFYPWKEYVKVGTVLRYCAYEVMALHGCLHSEIQAPYNLRIAFQSEIREASSQAADVVRSLGKDILNMKRNPHSSLLKRLHSSTEGLQRSIDMHSYLLTSSHDIMDYTKPPPPPISKSTLLSTSLSDLSTLLPISKPTLSTSLSDVSKILLEDATVGAKSMKTHSPAPTPSPVQAESYHEIMKKQQRRLYSWPSREVDGFEEEGNVSIGVDMLPRMRALESTAALSLTTFTSLLIEFVARLDHLVEAVDELARMAKFTHELVSATATN